MNNEKGGADSSIINIYGILNSIALMHVSRVATHSTLAGERGCGYSRVVARNYFIFTCGVKVRALATPYLYSTVAHALFSRISGCTRVRTRLRTQPPRLRKRHCLTKDSATTRQSFRRYPLHICNLYCESQNYIYSHHLQSFASPSFVGYAAETWEW